MHLARTHAAWILSLDADTFNSEDLTNEPQLQELLGNPLSSSQYPLILCLLFPNFDTSAAKLFKSKVLAKVWIIFSILYFKHQSFNCLDQFIKLVLFGAKSLTSASSKMCPMKGILWGVEKTTPGMITVAVTLVSICSAYFLLC